MVLLTVLMLQISQVCVYNVTIRLHTTQQTIRAFVGNHSIWIEFKDSV